MSRSARHPKGYFSGVVVYREKIHDNCSLFNGFFDFKEILAWHPTIFLRLFPRCSILANTNNDIQTIIPCIQTLSMSTSAISCTSIPLRSISDKRKCIVLEIFLLSISSMRTGYLKLFSGPITSLMDFLFCTRKVQCLDSSDLHHWNNRLTSEIYPFW